MEGPQGVEKASSDKVETTSGLLGNGEKQEAFDGNPRLDDDRNVLPTRRTPAVKARGPDQTNAGCGKRLVTAPPLSATGRAEQNTELRRHSRFEKTNLSLDHRSGCSAGGWPALREDFRVPIRGLHRRVSKSNTCLGNERHCSVPVPPLGCITGQSRTSPHHAGDQKTVQAEVRQLHCTIRKSGRLAQIQSDLNKSQLNYFQATDLALEESLLYRWTRKCSRS